VSNVPEETTPDDLFRLFSLYGNVMKVKIMYKKRSTALVQFQNHIQANLARANLNNCPFFGSHIAVTISNTHQIYMPGASFYKETSEDKEYLSKDYSNSKEHRYKVAGSKNFQNVTAPSQTLHLSNLPDCTNEELFGLLSGLFANTAQPTRINFFGFGKKMAYVKFGSLDESVRILVLFHNANIDGRLLKISFSKTQI